MVDFGNASKDRWVCPNDRQLALRAKLKTGWSVKTQQLQAYGNRQDSSLNESEQAIIKDVIKRAEMLEVTEQERVGPRKKFGTVKNYWPEFVIIGLEDVKAARTLMVDILNSTCKMRRDMWFQHDGSSLHFTLAVPAHLNNIYGELWIGRGKSVAWSARSPDLMPFDFFLWGHVKSGVYTTLVHTIKELIVRIEAAFGDHTRGREFDVILPVVLYGCETWSLTLREEQKLRVFENKVLRKIFGAKRDEVTREWRKLHNAELQALYSSPDIIRNIKSRRLRWAGHVARMGESRNAYRVLVVRPEGKRPLGRPRRRWEDNIKMDLREVGYDGRHWINLSQDRDQWRAYVRAAMTLRVP
ncbi:hypothetical protein ANN_19398 [Periplaneta americana]|uniref:Reverse transcriptase n=1 Tax=Periplaneta americana TaxID=6978 RepID=A0ABQ8SAR7_PERAM|nr:hypothetical protein ANN_19398 [Periplaneta americana]